MQNDEAITQLNHLLSHCRAAEKGYETAARQMTDAEQKTLLQSYSRQRSEFAYQLEQHIRILGGEPTRGPGIVSSAHRIWINLKGLVSGPDEKGTIRECIRGESESVKYYEDILNATTFSNDTRLLIVYQVQKIKEAKQELEALML